MSAFPAGGWLPLSGGRNVSVFFFVVPAELIRTIVATLVSGFWSAAAVVHSVLPLCTG